MVHRPAITGRGNRRLAPWWPGHGQARRIPPYIRRPCSRQCPAVSWPKIKSRERGASAIMGPLQGIKVIDMTTVLMGPYATQTLADFGADVIKVESLDGDVTRLIGPTRHPGMGPVFLNTNRGKRSICLDLKKTAGREAVLRLAEQADVLIYNVRPQAMTRLDLAHHIL